jgi:carbonic anhydrase
LRNPNEEGDTMMRVRSVLLLMCSVVPLIQVPTASAEEHPAVESMAKWDAFNELQAGNKRFLKANPKYHPDEDRRLELVDGQHPHSIVLSCSDSRVPPELIFDQGLGDIFTIRVAGEVLDASAIGSIEYAVEHLGSKVIVVLGHESCGAVKAALATPKGQSAGSPSLDKMIAAIQDNLDGNMLYSPEDKTLRGPVRANVTAVARQLVQRSPIIQKAIESGEILLAQGIYSLKSGEVEYWYVGQPVVRREPAGEGRAGSSRRKGGAKGAVRHAPAH